MSRIRFRVSGTVQGVGFRPFVYRHAVASGLSGFVRNDSDGVLIEVEGPADRIDALARAIVEDLPPLARVTELIRAEIEPLDEAGFRITESDGVGVPRVPVSSDSATCAECLAEIEDPGDRRYRYPFTNCTNCGPRYTIVRSVPYDRPTTTMAAFTMCGECQAEYDDPADRRFHAQPNACPACGPRVRFGDLVGDPALVAAVDALAQGAIVGVKGIGGYHLAAVVGAVPELRRRKRRDEKPFAVMVPDLASARSLVETDAAAEVALTAPSRPIVIAPARADLPGVAPGLRELGVFLPYSPLHHLLLRGVGQPLVMTSGNVSDEPIAHEDDDAVERLGALVDGLLTHDRPIHVRCDDSVVRGNRVLRRSRGLAPEPVRLPMRALRPILAVGAELKNTIAVAKDRGAVASHHIGDLEHLATYRSFTQAVTHLCGLYGVVPGVVACDLHPEYLSTKFAQELDLPLVAVQHHHAHVASCMVEHGRVEPVLGLAFDGLGYGTDGGLWGGEFLVADYRGAQRVGHLAEIVLPGGTAAIREPWRMALAWAARAVGPDEAVTQVADERAGSLVALLDHGPTTTSMGRLFDAVAALLGIRSRVSYEGQAAMELEAVAADDAGRQYPITVEGAVIDPTPLIAAILEDRKRGVDVATISAGFHASIGSAAAAFAAELAEARGLDAVVLTGGVFQNRRLAQVVESSLRGAGLEVLTHRLIPANDGGISIGQIAVAAAAPAA
ncbi:MAG: carbamoyltransferase HypF [Acidimicrobiales bacterium]